MPFSLSILSKMRYRVAGVANSCSTSLDSCCKGCCIIVMTHSHTHPVQLSHTHGDPMNFVFHLMAVCHFEKPKPHVFFISTLIKISVCSSVALVFVGNRLDACARTHTQADAPCVAQTATQTNSFGTCVCVRAALLPQRVSERVELLSGCGDVLLKC